VTARGGSVRSRAPRHVAGALCLTLATAMCTMGSGNAGAPALPVIAMRATAPAALTAAGPEARLVRTLHEIQPRRLDVALAEIDRLIEATPNFRLAHLVKGDLLLARVRPITDVGNAWNAPPERIADLREEARMRVARVRAERPLKTQPRYLLEMPPEQTHALVADMRSATLYVYENRGGEPHYVADYYITGGRNGPDKLREGDKRTPLGVYRVTGRVPNEKLTDFYGSGAFPIDYPNEVDRQQGRKGFGIWIHGTPSDTYARPPRASDGCVVLANADLDEIARRLQPGVTPLVIADGIEWTDAGTTARARRQLRAALEQWRVDWESRDTDRHLAHYAADFGGRDGGHERWAAHKRRVATGKTWVRVAVDDVSAYLYPGRNDLAVVSFRQDYASNNLSERMRKRQYWVFAENRWRILHEGAE